MGEREPAASWSPAFVSLLLVVAGCGDSPAPPRPLEIGVREPGLEFRQLVDGDTVFVLAGVGGEHRIEPSLRAQDVDPSDVRPEVSVLVSGIDLAGDLEEGPFEMRPAPDGNAHVLWNLRVPFEWALCCYVCREGTIEARIEDSFGREFEGRVTVLFSRGKCPDPYDPACCDSTDWCPEPSLTLLCE